MIRKECVVNKDTNEHTFIVSDGKKAIKISVLPGEPIPQELKDEVLDHLEQELLMGSKWAFLSMFLGLTLKLLGVYQLCQIISDLL